jgi:hypothetical protein
VAESFIRRFEALLRSGRVDLKDHIHPPHPHPYEPVGAVAAAGVGTNPDAFPGTDAEKLQAAINAGGVIALDRMYVVDAPLTLPAQDYVDAAALSITIRGPRHPAVVPSVIGPTQLPATAGIRATHNRGPLLSGTGPEGTFGGFTNVHLRLENLVIRTAPDSITALDLSRTAAVEIDNVLVDAGNLHVQGIAEPANATFGVRLPGNNNGALTRIGVLNVIGYGAGIEIGEHTNAENVAVWGCKRAVVAPFGHHASRFGRLMAVHCQRGIVATGAHTIVVEQFNIEHAAAGWWVTQADLDDAENLLRGFARWHVVLAGVGADATFTKNGGSGFTTSRL